MTVIEKIQENMPEVEDEDTGESVKVKLKAGASFIKVKPLFSHDSKFLIVASHCNLKVFSIASGDCFQTLKGHCSPIVSIQENKRNQFQILSCSEDGAVIRWDYTSGTAVKTYKLKVKTRISGFYAPLAECHWFITRKVENEESHRLYSVLMSSKTVLKTEQVMKPVLPDSRMIAFGVKVEFIAAVRGSVLLLLNYVTKSFKKHLYGSREFTCVVCHPSEYIVATGDNTGRVLIWANMLESNHPTRSIYHWHALPVADLAFSAEGSHVYSGGGEAALVKWNINAESRHILPRLGLPICSIVSSHDNSFVATSHIDNAVQIISAQNQVVQIIQGLTLGHFHGIEGNSIAPTGLQYDPRTQSIVVNGRPGHLQFYKVHEDKQLFNLDIVGRNIMCQERNSVVINPDVDKAALDHRGVWLATVHSRDDGETNPEIYLKFWQFELTTQKYTLNTSVFLPHYKKINCLKFRPPCLNSKDLSPPMAITTSDDTHFKFWVLTYTKDGDKHVPSWSCESMGYFRHLTAGDACFSEDGSLLAVAFGQVATLWTPETTMLKAALVQPVGKMDIRQLVFGQNNCAHLLACHSGSVLTVWDVLSMRVMWTINCEIQCLAGDPYSDVIAAFTKDNNMFVFRPNSSKSLAQFKNVSDTQVISAIFIPRQYLIPVDEQTSQNTWLQKSEIYFLNEDQELRTVCKDNDEEQDRNSNLKISESMPVTPFALLQAQHQRSAAKLETDEYLEIDENEKEILQRCGYQNPTLLCQMLIPSLLLQKKSTFNEEYTQHSTGVIELSESDSDEELEASSKDVPAVLSIETLSMETEECHTSETAVQDFGFLTNFLSVCDVNM